MNIRLPSLKVTRQFSSNAAQFLGAKKNQQMWDDMNPLHYHLFLNIYQNSLGQSVSPSPLGQMDGLGLLASWVGGCALLGSIAANVDDPINAGWCRLGVAPTCSIRIPHIPNEPRRGPYSYSLASKASTASFEVAGH